MLLRACWLGRRRVGRLFGFQPLELRDERVDALRAVHRIVARAHVDRAVGRLLGADDEDEVVP